jgi:hypothetical protein
VAQQEERGGGSLTPDLLDEHLRVAQVVVEPLDLAAHARGLPVAAQVVHVHGEAARRHVFAQPAVAAAVVAVAVDHGDDGLGRRPGIRAGILGKPRLQVQALSAAHELPRGVPEEGSPAGAGCADGAHDVRW